MPALSPRFGLIGHPLAHSLSPFIHRRLFALQGLREDYALFDLPEPELAGRLKELLPTLSGANVTVPYKKTVIPLCDRLEGKASLYRTVNCLAVTREGTVGYNTDAEGFLLSLQGAGLSLSGKVLILGCGGVGTMFACEAALAGCEITLFDALSPEKAVSLCGQVASLAPEASCRAAGSVPAERFDLLINASPVGMYPHISGCPVDDGVISRCSACFDAVYNPSPTVLLQKAEALGIPAVGGEAMLVWQAAAAQSVWLGARFDRRDIDAVIGECREQLASFR